MVRNILEYPDWREIIGAGDAHISKLAIVSNVMGVITFPCILHSIVPAWAWKSIRTHVPYGIFLEVCLAMITAVVGTIALVRICKSKEALTGIGFALCGAILGWVSVALYAGLLFVLMGLSPR